MSRDDDRVDEYDHARIALETMDRRLRGLVQTGELLGVVRNLRAYTYRNGWSAVVYTLGQAAFRFDGELRHGIDRETAHVLRGMRDRIRVLIAVMEVAGNGRSWLMQWLDVLEQPEVGDARRTPGGKVVWRRDAFGRAEFPVPTTRQKFTPIGEVAAEAYEAVLASERVRVRT